MSFFVFVCTYNAPQLVPTTAKGHSKHGRTLLSVVGLLALFVDRSCREHNHLTSPTAVRGHWPHSRQIMEVDATNGDGVDGVGVAVVVAVVVELSSVATGDHEDAAKSLSACNHTMLQCRLW